MRVCVRSCWWWWGGHDEHSRCSPLFSPALGRCAGGKQPTKLIKHKIAQLAACPLHYRLGARALRRAPRIRCDTLYAVGGLYGNSFALSSLLERANRETLRTQIVFNGDFNFLNCTPAWWRQINSEIRHGAVCGVPHVATLGNVEAEASTEHYTGCGCGYPSYTSPGVADRSDQIVRELHACAHAAEAAEFLPWLRGLPLGVVAEVGDRHVPVHRSSHPSSHPWRPALTRTRTTDPEPGTVLGPAALS